MSHLTIAPILIPLVTGAALLLLERKHDTRVLRVAAWIGIGLLLLAALALLRHAATGAVEVYLLGDWPARIGISLLADRLSALMVLTTTLLAVPCLLYAGAGWDQRALHFHALFQFQLMGLNGAFLTGDIFNLFVFFEVLLAASYGLLLSGARGERLSAGMHYVVFNIAASTLFLIALGVLYGLLGTLNMAEIAARIGAEPSPSPILHASVQLLLAVFCAKAALLPLYLWLPETYARAPAAVAALFTIMTKVGLYAILRTSTLILGQAAAPLTDFARHWLPPLGAATLVLAGLGVIGAPRLRILVAYLVLASAGLLFIAFTLGEAGAIAAGLYYLPHSAFATAALFMIAALAARQRGDAGDDLLALGPAPDCFTALACLLAAIAAAGLPPLSGFIGKFLLLQAIPPAQTAWVWTALLSGSLLSIIGLARAGTRLFWRVGPSPRVREPLWQPRRGETAAVALLLAYGLALTLGAGPALRYAEATAAQLLTPADGIRHLRQASSHTRATPP